MSASEMAMEEVPDTLMIVSYVSQYHEVFKNETPGTSLLCFFAAIIITPPKDLACWRANTQNTSLWIFVFDLLGKNFFGLSPTL